MENNQEQPVSTKTKVIKLLKILGILLLILCICGLTVLRERRMRRLEQSVKDQSVLIEDLKSKTNIFGGISTTTNGETPSNLSETNIYKVYFQKLPDAKSDPSYVEGVNRATLRTDIVTFLVEEFLQGPTKDEINKGFHGKKFTLSGESDCQGKDFTIVVANKVVTVQFCKQIKYGGDLDPSTTEGLTKTLTELSTIDKVILLDSDGNCFNDLSGMNACLN